MFRYTPNRTRLLKTTSAQQSIFGVKIAEIKLFHPVGANTLRLFCSNKTAAKKTLAVPNLRSLPIKSFKNDLCSAEEVLRTPALMVQ